jgi:hypothetical protein
MHPIRPVLLLGLAVVAGCGSVSGLTREQSSAPARIADFSRVEVMEFTASDQTVVADPKKAEERAKSIAEARLAFANKIAEEIRATGAFEDVTVGPGKHPALRVTGDISRYDEGNIVARGLTGFAGQTHFDARVNFVDADTGAVLSTITMDRNSWPLPVGASLSTLQTTNYFMNNGAKKIASELAAKKGVAAAAGQ